MFDNCERMERKTLFHEYGLSRLLFPAALASNRAVPTINDVHSTKRANENFKLQVMDLDEPSFVQWCKCSKDCLHWPSSG